NEFKQISECGSNDIGDDCEGNSKDQNLISLDLASIDAVRDKRDEKQGNRKNKRYGKTALESLDAKGGSEPLHEPFIEPVHRDKISLEWGNAAKPLFEGHTVIVAGKLQAQRAVGERQEPAEDRGKQRSKHGHDREYPPALPDDQTRSVHQCPQDSCAKAWLATRDDTRKQRCKIGFLAAVAVAY